LTFAEFRKLESIPLGVGFIGVLLLENRPAGLFIEKKGHTDIGTHTDTIIFIYGKNERSLKIDVCFTTHMQAAFVATAYTWTVSPGIKVSGA
jgi:hypothetical protein